VIEIENVFKSYFQHCSSSGSYKLSYCSYELQDDDRKVAIVREFLQGNVAEVRLSARQANADTSMVQMFVDAADTIHNELILMEQLAEQAAYGYYTSTDIASMQKQFEVLAQDINSIVGSTEYDGNKLFMSDGQTITKVIMRSFGSARTISLFAKDLSLDVSNLDLTKDAEGALAAIKNAIEQASEYTTYLTSQNQLLQDSMAVIEEQMASAAGVNTGEFVANIVRKMMGYLTAAIQDEPYISYQVQSNITADEALYLLKGN